MTYIFKKALVRKPSTNVLQAISSRNLKLNYKKVSIEHEKYIQSLICSDVDINILEPLENFPDSLFIEDPAITFKEFCILLKSNIKSRFEESKALAIDGKKYFQELFFVQNGKIEGGDILRINNHFIIGLSERTDKKGAENLSIILESLGASVEISKTPNNVLHFKSECSLIDDNTILLTNKMANIEAFRKYNKIIVAEEEKIISNCLRINKNLLIPRGFKKTQDILSKNYQLILLDVNEISKADAGLSCMSIRW